MQCKPGLFVRLQSHILLITKSENNYNALEKKQELQEKHREWVRNERLVVSTDLEEEFWKQEGNLILMTKR
jgi:hypothetical protein